MKKKDLISILAIGILILGLGVGLILIKQSQEIRKRASGATDVTVSLSPTSYTLTKDQKTTVGVVLSNSSSPARDISLNSAGVDLQFDLTSYTVSNVVCNSGFLSSAVTASTSGNKISISCFAPGGTAAKTISGGGQSTLGSFDITALDKTGATDITFTRVNVPDATTYAELSGGGGSGGTYTISAVGGRATPTPSPTQAPTSPPGTGGGSSGGGGGSPNSCGGTCGSDSNCQSGLYCFQGFCRNPSCATSATCVCAAKTPTPKPKGSGVSYATITPSATATPEIVTIITPLPTEIPSPVPTPQTLLGKLTSGNILLLLGGGAVLLSLIAALILVFKKRDENPPQINPPLGEASPPAGQTNPPETGTSEPLPYPYNQQPENPPPSPAPPQSPPPPPQGVNFMPRPPETAT